MKAGVYFVLCSIEVIDMNCQKTEVSFLGCLSPACAVLESYFRGLF